MPALSATCPHCQRSVGTFVPKQGDGTARYLYRHRCTEGQLRAWVEAPGWRVSDSFHSPSPGPSPGIVVPSRKSPPLCANGDGNPCFSTDPYCEPCLKKYGDHSTRPGFF